MIIAAYRKYREIGKSNGGVGGKVDVEKEVNEGEVPVDPMAPLVCGGDGPPRSCCWKGEERAFHDGGELSSPGRWKRSPEVSRRGWLDRVEEGDSGDPHRGFGKHCRPGERVLPRDKGEVGR